MSAVPDPVGVPDDIVPETAVTTPDAAFELAALRGVALHNMRLLKAQIVPLIEAALRSASDGLGVDASAGMRGRWTASAVRLIDDTAIAASSEADGGALETVDLSALIREAANWHQDRIGPLALGDLPLLTVRAGHMRLLVSELMTTIAWIGPKELPNGLRVDVGACADGQVVIWFQDGDLAPPDIAALDFEAEENDRMWSLCCNLIGRMGARFHQSRIGQGRLSLAIRFPADLVQADEAGGDRAR